MKSMIHNHKLLISLYNFNNSITPNWSEIFGCDGFGNITNIIQNGISLSFSYDKLNRIQQENLPSGQNTYSYDDQGNRKTLTTTSLSINKLVNYEYNSLNQLTKFTDAISGDQSNYTYYSDGLRATKRVNDQVTRYLTKSGM